MWPFLSFRRHTMQFPWKDQEESWKEGKPCVACCWPGSDNSTQLSPACFQDTPHSCQHRGSHPLAERTLISSKKELCHRPLLLGDFNSKLQTHSVKTWMTLITHIHMSKSSRNSHTTWEDRWKLLFIIWGRVTRCQGTSIPLGRAAWKRGCLQEGTGKVEAQAHETGLLACF